MFSFAVCFLWTVFATALSQYLPTEEYQHNLYETEYAHEYDNYEPSDYHFQYAVSDPHTGDHKSQWEVKEKGVVRGMYSLLEPDGTTRVVEYIADDHGFRATVKKLGTPIETHHHHGEDIIVPLSEAYNSGYHGAYSGQGINYGIASYGAPIIESGHDHGTSVEIHGFTGNANDDSSYTNYDHDDTGVNNAAIYYQNDDIGNSQHNYYNVQPEIVSVPYKFAYQYEKPYAYIGQGYDGY